MRGKLISFTSHLKRTKGQKLADLQTRLKLKQQEDINNPNPTVKQEIRKLQGDISDVYTQEIQKNLTFLRQKYYEIGGKSAKYLANKLRKQREESTIYKIMNPNTNILETKLERIQECFEAFYRDLYIQPDASGEDCLMPFSAI